MTHLSMMISQVPMWQDGGHMMGFHWGWWAFSIVLLLLLVVGVVRSLGGGARDGGPPPTHSSAEEVLRSRFAAGEIDEEEYNRRLAALRSGR